MVIIISCKCLQSFETLRIIVDIDVYWNFVIIETFKVDTSNTKTLLEKRGDLIRDKGILVRPPYSCDNSFWNQQLRYLTFILLDALDVMLYY